MREINAASLDLIKSFEGWRAESYQDAVGVWTIGYGHTSAAGDPIVKPGMTITKAFGEHLLRTDLRKYAAAVEAAVKVPLTDNQFGALVSWCYNVGPAAMRKSTLVRKLNAGLYDAVPSELAKWNKAKGKVLNGLTRRRKAEAELFLSKATGKPASAPSPVPAPEVPSTPKHAPAGSSDGWYAKFIEMLGRIL